jgi:predicted O-methyltransferase YrrM
MHATSLENLQKCVDRYLSDTFFTDAPRRVVDIGSMNVNGTYRSIFKKFDCEYVGFDLEPGPGVDRVLANPYEIPLADGAADVIVSGQTFEHCEFFWDAFREMMRILSPNGLLFLIAPSAGPIHRFPVDCYRFYPDAYHALARYAGCHLVTVWRDERGPWQDLTGVFSKDPKAGIRQDTKPRFATQNIVPVSDDPKAELVSGGLPTLEFLSMVHEQAKPRSYLEIGVRQGASLALAHCPTVAVDPEPDIKGDLASHISLYARTSDDFFEFDAATALKAPLDLVLIDGMHLFEFALRDFMNAERYAHPGTIFVIDDVFPNHPRQAERNRQTVAWTGDVWKIARCLADFRPDLQLIPIDTKPAGLLLILGSNPKDSKLWAQYNRIIGQYNGPDYAAVPEAVLNREGAFDPNSAAIRSLLATVAAARPRVSPALVKTSVQKFREAAAAGSAQ